MASLNTLVTSCGPHTTCGPWPSSKWHVEPLLTCDINMLNILILCFKRPLWHLAKSPMSEWPAVKKDCIPLHLFIFCILCSVSINVMNLITRVLLDCTVSDISCCKNCSTCCWSVAYNIAVGCVRHGFPAVSHNQISVV